MLKAGFGRRCLWILSSECPTSCLQLSVPSPFIYNREQLRVEQDQLWFVISLVGYHKESFDL